MRGLLTLAAFSVLLISCAMGPDYSRPDIATSDSFRMDGEEKDLPSLANVPWWELYHDDELQKLIRTALEENRDLKRAVATVDEFAARSLIAKTDFAPQMNATVNAPAFGNTKNVAFPGFPNPFNYYVQGNLAWEMDIWGRIRRSNEAALGDLLAREENRRAVIVQIVGGVAQAYFDLRQFDMQLEIAKRTLTAWEESVRIGQARLRQGHDQQAGCRPVRGRARKCRGSHRRADTSDRSERERTQRTAGEESQPNIQGAVAHGTGDAACGAGWPALRTTPTAARCGPGGARPCGSDRQDRCGQGRPVSQAQHHRHSGYRQSTVVPTGSQRDLFRCGGPKLSRTTVQCAEFWASNRKRPKPSQAGFGSIRADDPRRVQGS